MLAALDYQGTLRNTYFKLIPPLCGFLPGLLFLLLSGCTNLAYYGQAAQGHLQLLAATKPIAEWVSDPATDPLLRQRLEYATRVRDFASQELALPDNGSYRAYADLGRPHVVWNVMAAAEFSVAAKQWCLLIVGCVSYRGYYDQAAAERYASELRAQGLDTFVGGVSAYSTLGFFNDPVLNTFLRFGEIEVARLIVHELAHQQVYVSDDTAFNESFATSVENEGLRRWLNAEGDPATFAAFTTQQTHKANFQALVSCYRQRLRRLYATALSSDEMRQAKEQTFNQLRADHERLKQRGQSSSAYDRWFDPALNNARLASVSLYSQWVPAFTALLAAEQGRMPRFYQRVKALAEQPKAQRDAMLRRLLPDASRAENANYAQAERREGFPDGGADCMPP